jgi:hypothetical protein
MPTIRTDNLTVERLTVDVDQGILDDDVETYMPSHLFGPPTAAELASAVHSNGDARYSGSGAASDAGQGCGAESSSESAPLAPTAAAQRPRRASETASAAPTPAGQSAVTRSARPSI